MSRRTMGINIPLKIAIMESGKSQSDIAQTIGMYEPKLSRIVRGYAHPTEAEMRALAKVLRRPVQQLFPDTEQCA
jgi:transcriptional regulator with XRE-family HTH domain